MSTPEALQGWYANGVEIKPEEMTPDFKNYAMVVHRIQQRLLESHRRGEIDLKASAEKFKAEKANKSKNGVA